MQEQSPKGTRYLEFHVSRGARDRYQFDQVLFTVSGNVVFANVRAARVFAQRMNQKRDLVNYPEQVVRAGQINAMGLIDEILHFVVGQYLQQRAPQAMAQAVAWIEERIGTPALDATLRKFADAFPPLAVYRREISLDDYLVGETNGIANRQLALEEMLMLWLENMNPAFNPYLELFDDATLEKGTSYLTIMRELHAFFATQPTFGPDDQQLDDMLRSPAIAVPHSLPGQLEYILSRWGYLLGTFLYRLLSSLDLIKEEEKAIFGGPGPSLVYDYSSMGAEPERFSQDREWMPRLVLMAKNAYVWLDQLSKQYGRAITRLDEIPEEELATLARRGFSGLWLIGLWERSQASQTVKQWCGNPDAVASAYSVHDYDIANDLGGDGALQNLKARAWQHGIRLASDMVPNHMGIDSTWVMEHPDWFIGLDYSPFPSYSFTGSSLSNNDRVGIYIEDHYFSRNDAAVVFKRVDHATGSTRYIYHGNDGTSMPWNDTAQLDFLKAQVREAVIQTILHVARQFPVIRFDAAMTLAKKHYQRLWFPEPGTGGAIPSRAEHGLTRAQLDAAMPEEFWREVVDRVATEAPDTLLLAEAFWLMEGYFVRTLGMHRVYNSAFMNMLRDEDNAKYRSVMKNTMEFDLEILKRYVNFMNNPDERTAIDQFGDGDKYFGVCVVMATLPGLPMFGHGQIEGYTEKYGMEYRRAYWDEQPNAGLVARHEREISPLLHRRHIFADARDFLLYDFYAPEGHVNEDVFAYSNRCGDERGLVVYHNKFAATRGWVRTSAAFAVKGPDGAKSLQQRSLGEGLGLHHDGNYFTIYREQVSGLEFIRSSKELCERGMYVELEAYKYQVFLDFREVADNEWRHYSLLHSYLNGRGVPSIDAALREIFLQPIHRPFKELANAGFFGYLLDSRVTAPGDEVNTAALDELEGKALTLLREINAFTGSRGDATAIARELRTALDALLRLPAFAARYPLPGEPDYPAAVALLCRDLDGDPAVWGTLFGWLIVHALGKAATTEDYAEQSRSWLDEWLLNRLLAGALIDLGLDEGAAWRAVATIALLTTHQRWYAAADADNPHLVLTAWLQDPEVQRFLQVNRHQGVLWFNEESFEHLLWWMHAIAAVNISADQAAATTDVARRVLAAYQTITHLHHAEKASEFQLDKLLEAAQVTVKS